MQEGEGGESPLGGVHFLGKRKRGGGGGGTIGAPVALPTTSGAREMTSGLAVPAGRMVAPLPRVMVSAEDSLNWQEGPLPSLATVAAARIGEQSLDSPREPCITAV